MHLHMDTMLKNASSTMCSVDTANKKHTAYKAPLHLGYFRCGATM